MLALFDLSHILIMTSVASSADEGHVKQPGNMETTENPEYDYQYVRVRVRVLYSSTVEYSTKERV